VIRKSHILAIVALVGAFSAGDLPCQKAAPTDYTVEGRVTDWVTGDGITYVTIEAVENPKRPKSGASVPEEPHSTLTAKDGSYRLEHLPKKPKLTLRCSQVGYSPNPQQAEIEFKNGAARWDVHLFLSAGGKDYLKAAADKLSTIGGPDKIVEAKFVADNAGADGQVVIATELREIIRAHGSDAGLKEVAGVFHVDQLPPDHPPGANANTENAKTSQPTPPAQDAQAKNPPPPETPPANAPNPPPNYETASYGDTAITRSLESQYTLTKATADRSDIVTAGSVLTLRKDGLLMYTTTTAAPPTNTYRDGKISQGIFGLSNCKWCRKIPGTTSAPNVDTRTFVAGEKFWVTKIEVRSDGIYFELLSDPYTDVRYYSILKFPFLKGSTPSADQISKMVAEVLKAQPQDNPAGGGNSLVAEAAAPAPPIAPLPPPADAAPAAPVTIAIGQTKEQVVAIFGKPLKIAILGTKEIYWYPEFKITFVNGKITNVQ
jgi:hypothetical protein